MCSMTKCAVCVHLKQPTNSFYTLYNVQWTKCTETVQIFIVRRQQKFSVYLDQIWFSFSYMNNFKRPLFISFYNLTNRSPPVSRIALLLWIWLRLHLSLSECGKRRREIRKHIIHFEYTFGVCSKYHICVDFIDEASLWFINVLSLTNSDSVEHSDHF